MSEKYYDEYVQLGNLLGERLGFKFNPYLKRKSHDKRMGYTTPIVENNITVNVYVSPLYKENTEIEFAKALMVLFHEIQHIKQCQSFKPGSKTDDMFWDMISSINNVVYYNTNYCQMSFEIDANLYGIKETYSYLKILHSEIDSEKILVDIIKDKVNNNELFYLSNDFNKCKSVSDIIERYLYCYEQSLNSKREYLSIFNSSNHSKKSNLAFHISSKQISENEVSQLMNTLSSGIEQSRFIASYPFKIHPEYKKLFNNKEIKQISFDAYIKAYEEFKKEPTDLTENLNDRKRRFADLVRKHESEIYKRRENYLRE